MKPHLAQLRIHPIKALDAALVSEARIAPGGSLVMDRRWALVDEQDRFVNGKNEPAVFRIRARWNLSAGGVPLWTVDEHGAEARAPRGFELEAEPAPLEAWMGDVLGRPVRLRRDDELGFPDDREAPGPTIVSTASLAEVAFWFGGLDLNGARRRFRTNLELDGVGAFWEDRLFAAAGMVVPFRVGDVRFEGTNPCQRCVVPSRDADTGALTPGFQKTFAQRRRATLPPTTEVTRFDHFYRFAVNTRVPASEAGKTLRVGDEILI